MKFTLKFNKLKPGLYKNEDLTFTLVRQDGTIAIYSLLQIKQILNQDIKEGKPGIDKNTFSDFLRIHL